ncbi:Aste57867_11802 [Aphanomyces stellatus]|uniref:Aste57867_11802 protein n=1 Tax=Aphanomyces stellatus TaxID=120398 RepID=A0A485KU70_9STRA|nr:hypothetical protein As57867_011757 [Aphanomyces stellatus]VFT88657.1 Aste57867_11802 [Aphanomyces stellatus]
MSAPIDDLLYDDDDDDDISMGDTEMTGGFVQPPVAMGLVSPPGAVLAPPQIIAPPVGVIAPPLAAMAAPIAYTPSPTGPPQMSSEEKIKKLFQIIQTQHPDKYKPVYDEVRTRRVGLKNDLNFILDILKRALGEPLYSLLVQQVGGFPTAATPPRTFPTQPAATMKTEPSSIPMPMPVQPPTTFPTPVVSRPAMPQPVQAAQPVAQPVAPIRQTVAPTPAAPVSAQSAEANDKIKFARQLLTHASTCTLMSGQCQVKKCDDIKRFFKHSLTCGKGRECNHCEQLRMLVKLHATECTVGGTDHCPIPFCDSMRPSATSARQAAIKEPPPPSPKPMEEESIKKQPMAMPTKPASTPAAATPSPMHAPTPQAPPPVAVEYGRILQMIFHCQTCSAGAACRVPGCAESKDYMREMNNPDTSVIKAKTYLQVFTHYKMCKEKQPMVHKACPVCSIGLQPLPYPSSAAVATPLASAQTPPPGMSKRPSTSSPRSPNGSAKKQKPMPTSALKKASQATYQAPSAIETYDLQEELAPTNANDLRREADVLTHTNIDPQAEKRIMLAGVPPKAKQLAPKRESWNELFQHAGLQQTMARALAAGGVQAGHASDEVTEVMGLALHEYLKQALEEMVEIAKQRNDAYGNSIPRKTPPPPPTQPTKTAVEILRMSSDEHFNRQMQVDQALRSELLEEGRKDESADKDRSNKRRKSKAKNAAPSASAKKDWMDKDEEDMDVDELARKDLKMKLLHEGTIMLDGRVNTSIAPTARRNKQEYQISMEDAEYWLRSQKPYIDAKLFCRAAAARIHSKNV